MGNLLIDYVLAIIAFLGLMYTIYYNSAPFAKNKIIFDIFDELDQSKALKNKVISKTKFLSIYIFALIIFPFLYDIINIILILLVIIIVSSVLIVIIALFERHYNKKITNSQNYDDTKSEKKILTYKVSSVLFHVYIIFFVYIILISIINLPALAFISIPFFFFYWNHYSIKVFASLYIVAFTDEFLFIIAQLRKYSDINAALLKPYEKLWITVLLKNGKTISGNLEKIDPTCLKLIDFEKTTYKIKYKQIEVIGSKYQPSYIKNV